MKIQPIRITQLEGGLSTKDETIIEDNQVSEATNVFFNENKMLQSRFGKRTFGELIPDHALLVQAMNSISGWTASEDAASLAIDNTDNVRGTHNIKFDIDVSATANDLAVITRSSVAVSDITEAKGSLRFFFKVPVDFKVDLDHVYVRLGSSATDYYQFEVVDYEEDEWNFIILPFSSATVVGTPDDTDMQHLQIRIEYQNTYLDQSEISIDEISVASDTYSATCQSVYFFKSSEYPNFKKTLLVNCGNAVWEFHEPSGEWFPIRYNMPEDARFDFTAYKNIIYMTAENVDFAAYNGKNVTILTGPDTYQGKYLLLANDVGFIAGDNTVPSSLAYSNATPAGLSTFPNVLVVDEDSSDGVITGLINLGPIVFVMKEKKIYKVNIAAPSREQIDYSDGFLSHRALIRVENEIFGLNQAGIYTLGQREATVGSVRAEAMSDDIKRIIDSITDKSIVSGLYISKLKNVYFFIDTLGTGISNATLVYSVLTRSWTQYNNLNFTDCCIYEDENGEEIALGVGSNGRVTQFEVGFSDDENIIESKITTKNYDWGTPEILKTTEMVEVFGFINESGEIRIRIFVDNELASGDVLVNGSDFSDSVNSFALGTNPLSSLPLAGSGGSGSSEILREFKVRIPMYATGAKIKLEIANRKLNSTYIINKFSIYPYPQPVDIYPNIFIA
jgi:hypothetical protein